MTARDNHESVGQDEFVLRRIHRNHCSPDLPVTVHLAAFRPSREDTLGLSVFRERFAKARTGYPRPNKGDSHAT